MGVGGVDVRDRREFPRLRAPASPAPHIRIEGLVRQHVGVVGLALHAVLLPLTETPVSEEVLSAIHVRLSGRRISGSDEMVEQTVRAGGVTVFPGWEFYAPLAGAEKSLLDFLPGAAVILDEPVLIEREQERWWGKLTEIHERSLIGNLVGPHDLYLSPEEWKARVSTLPGADIEHLGLEVSGVESLALHSQPTPKFNGSIPAMVEEVQRLTQEGKQVRFSNPAG